MRTFSVDLRQFGHPTPTRVRRSTSTGIIISRPQVRITSSSTRQPLIRCKPGGLRPPGPPRFAHRRGRRPAPRGRYGLSHFEPPPPSRNKGSRIKGGPHEAEAQGVDAGVGRAPEAVRHAGVHGRAVPAPATSHPEVADIRAPRIPPPRKRRPIPVPHPLPHVPTHVEKSPPIRSLPARRVRP